VNRMARFCIADRIALGPLEADSTDDYHPTPSPAVHETPE
jgi:hypothetical protein